MVDTAAMSTTHRKAIIEVQLPSHGETAATKKLRRQQRSWLQQGMAMWQRDLATWLDKWEWAHGDEDPEVCITWLELLIGYEIGEGRTIPTHAGLDDTLHRSLAIKPGLNKVVQNFKLAIYKIWDAHYTKDAVCLFQRIGKTVHGAGCMRQGLLAAGRRLPLNPIGPTIFVKQSPRPS